MEWLELTIRTVSQGVDLLCAELTESGFDSFVVEDHEQFEAFLEDSRDYWDYVDEDLSEKMQTLSQVRLYLEEAQAQQQLPLLQQLLQELPSRYPACEFGELTIALENVPQEDWENSWKKHYRPLPVGEKLLVVPQWIRVEDTGGRLPVILDLGLTFGTGAHDSTQMCMRALERLVQGGERVADLGSGSGILSICALRLGAASAVGIDIDPAAEHIATENAARNGFTAPQFSACTGNVIEDRQTMERLAAGGYDLVCANIVAGVLVALAPVVPAFLRPNASFLCSGILREREAEVRRALEAAGLQITDCERTEEWCCLVAKGKES
ncbi:MAG: 50S ribosomal protein L11 methyltransferase [Oscillospiraceae bacterium]|nr:50S ribosomal protein L11 methyltransferase [Oscillospiraceae bacterium]